MGVIAVLGFIIQLTMLTMQLTVWCFRHIFHFSFGSMLACAFFDEQLFFPLFGAGLIGAAVADWILDYASPVRRQVIFGLVGIAGGMLLSMRMGYDAGAQLMVGIFLGIISVWQADLPR